MVIKCFQSPIPDPYSRAAAYLCLMEGWYNDKVCNSTEGGTNDTHTHSTNSDGPLEMETLASNLTYVAGSS